MKTHRILITCLSVICGDLTADVASAPLDITPLMTEAAAAGNRGDFAAAERLLRDVLAKVRADAGGDHPALGLIQCELGFAIAKQGRKDEAVALFRAGHSALRKALGDIRPDIVLLAVQFADAMHASGHAGDALEILLELQAAVESPPLSPSIRGQFLERLARSFEAAKREREALSAYESARVQYSKTQDAAGADVVRVATSADALRSRLGMPEERKFVGALGVTSVIEFAGNRTFPADDLRFALAGTYEYLMAAHPSAPFNNYASTVQALLRRGYRDAGFRDARVSAAPSDNGAKLFVQVEEGPRFVKGEIRVLGTEAIPAGKLVAALTGKPNPPTNELAMRVTEFVAKRSAPKRRTELEASIKKLGQRVPSFALGAENTGVIDLSPKNNSVLGSLDFSRSASKSHIFWEVGKPFSFDPSALENARSEMARILAEQGDFLTKVNVEMEADSATGKVALIYKLSEEPSAVIGEIKVVGNQRDSAAEVIAAAGLEKGAKFTSETIRNANLALWNSARFLNFDLVPKQRGDGRREVDITVDVEEFSEMQPLREPLTRAQAALVKLAGWMTTELVKREFVLNFSDSAGDELAMGTSPSEGTALLLNTRAHDPVLGLYSGPEIGAVVAASGKRAAAREFGGWSGSFQFDLGLIPAERSELRKEKPFSLHFSFGVSSVGEVSQGGKQGLKADVLIAPVALSAHATDVSPESLKFEDGTVWFADSKAEVNFRFVEATGELIEMDSASQLGDSGFGKLTTRLRAKSGEVSRIRKVLDDAKRGHDPASLARESIFDVISAAPIVRKLTEMVAESFDLDSKGVLVSSRLFERFIGSLSEMAAREKNGKKDDSGAFSIPPDLSAGSSMLTVMFGPIYFQWAQEMWPADAWPAKLGREIFYVMAGNTRYTPLVLDELYKDPSMGPFGSYMTAQLLEKMDPKSAWRFLQRARERSSVEDLRRELSLLLNVRGKGEELLREMMEGLSKFDAESFEAFVAMLEPEFTGEVAEWRKALSNLKTMTPADALIPRVVHLWENGGRTAFQRRLDGVLEQNQPDAWVAAAIVNGEPVSRKWLNNLGPALRLDRHVVARPTIDGTPATESAPMLDALLALRLVQQDYKRRGGKVSRELLEKAMNQLSGGDVAKLQATLTRASMTQEDFPIFIEQWMTYKALEEQCSAGVKPPTDEEIHVESAGKLAELANVIHLRFLRTPKSAAGRAMLDELRTQAAKDGFGALWDRLGKKKPDGLELGEYKDLDRNTLNETLTKAAYSQEVGQVGGVLESGDFAYVLYVVQKGASEKMMAEARRGLVAEIIRKRTETSMREHIERLRAAATIAVLPLPARVRVQPPAKNVTRLDGESLKVIAHEKSQPSVMSMSQWGADYWSGGRQAMVNGVEGAWVEWEFEVKDDEEDSFVLHATRASNFGKIQVAVDGKPFERVIDLYSAGGVIPSGPRYLGKRKLSKGAHKLRISVVDRNPEASSMDFGFDALDLVFERPLVLEKPDPK